MRVVSKQEKMCTCKRCKSVIAILPHEFSTVEPIGPYDMDYDPNEGKTYWICPVCKVQNWTDSSNHDDDDNYY